MRGHLVIADISGYTRFLTESELDHANGIISDLLNAVINTIHAPMTVSSIEGDAVFMYGSMPKDAVGQTVIEAVEMLYSAFASALETMVLNTTCRCNACININTLGMKIVMHCGEFAKSDIGGHETLSGSDVILIHRLLKNQITETTGIDDYMMVTQACVDELGVTDLVSTWTEHTEEYEHVGAITGYVASLKDVWAFTRQQNEDKVLQRDASIELGTVSAAPPAIVWDHLLDPRKRVQWMNQDDVHLGEDQGPRIGVGSDYHCAHGGDSVSVFTIVDMKPLEYMTFLTVLEEGTSMRYTEYLIPSGTGTRIVTFIAPLLSSNTGEELTPDRQEKWMGILKDIYEDSMGRLVAMSDAATAELLAV